jgi:hypothetical protein
MFYCRQGDAGIQILPSATTLSFRSTRNQRSNCSPIIATVRMYCILQLAVFVFCPFTLVSIHPVNAGIQDIVPSIITLFFRSTWNHRCNYTPIIATVRWYCIFQLDIFAFCSFTCTPTGSVDAGIQAMIPSVPTLFFRSTRN